MMHKYALRILCWNEDVRELDIEVALVQGSKLRDKDKTTKTSCYSCVTVHLQGTKAGCGLLT